MTGDYEIRALGPKRWVSASDGAAGRPGAQWSSVVISLPYPLRDVRRTAIVAVSAACILFGLSMRFFNIELHGFWGDEAITELRTGGRTQTEIREMLAHGMRAGDVRPAIWPTRGQSPGLVVRALEIDDPQHTPAYYLLAYYWQRLVGSGVLQIRILSILVSLAAIALLWQLMLDLFESRSAAAIAAGLFAISPFFLEYAQQAREYALCACWVVLSTALFVRWLKRPANALWIAYTLALIVGMYIALFFALAIVAHGVYLAAARSSRQTIVKWAISVSATVLGFAPWIYVLATSRISHYVRAYGAIHRESLRGIAYAWLTDLAAPFTGLQYIDVRYLALAPVIVAMLVAFCIVLWRSPLRRPALLPFLLLAAGGLLQIGGLGLQDEPRYLTAALLGELPLAGAALALLLSSKQHNRIAVGTLLWAFLIALCVNDDIVRSTSAVWWSNNYGAPLLPIARRLAGEPGAAVVAEDSAWQVLYDESPLLPPQDRVALVTPSQALRLAKAEQRIYILDRTDYFARRLAHVAEVRALPVAVAPRGYALLLLALSSRASKDADNVALVG